MGLNAAPAITILVIIPHTEPMKAILSYEVQTELRREPYDLHINHRE